MRWISLETALAIHKKQIAEHGGGDGIRDVGLLESAVMRPQNIFSYDETAGIAQLAAAYAFGIAKNHPFVDGNKRTALVVMRTFLILNGSDIKAGQDQKYLTITGLADTSLSEKDLAGWIADHLIQV